MSRREDRLGRRDTERLPVRRSPWTARASGRALAALASLAIAACTPGLSDRGTTPAGSTSPINEVTIRGEVSAVLGPHVFELGRPGGDPLVIVVLGASPVLSRGRRVEVTGVTREFRVRALRDEFGVPLPDGRYEALNGVRSLVVSDVERLDASRCARAGRRETPGDHQP